MCVDVCVCVCRVNPRNGKPSFPPMDIDTVWCTRVVNGGH